MVSVKKKVKRAQASLEYLLTYGWALVLLVAVVSVLFVLTGAPSGYACSGLGKMLCKTVSAEGSDLFVVLQNGSGRDISIDPFTGIEFDGRSGFGVVVYQGKEYRFEKVSIKAGDSFVVKGKSVNSAGSLKVTYKETDTGFTKSETIGLETPKKEICNNLVADTPANLPDCLNPECDKCEYAIKGLYSIYQDSVKIIHSGYSDSFNIRPITSLAPSLYWEINYLGLAFYANDAPANAYLDATNITGNYEEIYETGSLPSIKNGWNIVSLGPMANYHLTAGEETLGIYLESTQTGFSMSTKPGTEPRLIIAVKHP